jgi:sortase A
MGRKLGNLFMGLGLLLLAAALALFCWNRWDAHRAAAYVEEVLPQLAAQVEENVTKRQEAQDTETEPDDLPILPTIEEEPTLVTIDGVDYLGWVTIPDLGLELPVAWQWSYPQLRQTPCRYTGTVAENNLVIAAHNYDRHFGKLSSLTGGEIVYFTDGNGTTIAYEVVAVDILAPTDIEDMTAGEYDLTLFTCTYGGKSRVTVRCMRSK